eukprot:2727343-Pyramimonas_sp.AAC.1
MLGAVWPKVFQTPQAAEHLGMASLICLTTDVSCHPHSDCAGAARLRNASRREQLDPKQIVAGF